MNFADMCDYSSFVLYVKFPVAVAAFPVVPPVCSVYHYSIVLYIRYFCFLGLLDVVGGVWLLYFSFSSMPHLSFGTRDVYPCVAAICPKTWHR